MARKKQEKEKATFICLVIEAKSLHMMWMKVCATEKMYFYINLAVAWIQSD